MDEAEVLDYVKAAARAVALPLDDQRAQAVAQHLARTVGIARLLGAVQLEPIEEPAEVYRPAPFPPEDPA